MPISLKHILNLNRLTEQETALRVGWLMERALINEGKPRHLRHKHLLQRVPCELLQPQDEDPRQRLLQPEGVVQITRQQHHRRPIIQHHQPSHQKERLPPGQRQDSELLRRSKALGNMLIRIHPLLLQDREQYQT